MSLTYNPLSGNLETKEPGPQGPAGTVSAAGNGSQGAPSISFASDTTTGLYKYANESIAVSTAGTGKLFINSNGNVGIGATSIDEKLHLESSNATVRVKVESTAANSYPGVRLTNDAKIYDLQIDGATDAFRVYDGSASQERLRVTSAGALGLGTTLPSTALHINSTNNFTIATTNQTNAANSYISFVDTGTTAGHVRCGSQGNDFVVNAGGGRGMTITASGTAEFAGKVQSINASAPTQFMVGTSATSAAARAQFGYATGSNHFLNGSNAGDVCITFPSTLRFGSSGSSSTISFSNNGSATYTADVISGTGNYSTGNNASLHPQGNVSASRTSPTDAIWFGYTAGNTTPTSVIKADGTATFTNRVESINSSAPTQFMIGTNALTASARAQFGYATGANNFLNGASSGDVCITFPSKLRFGLGGGSSKINFSADGTAEFGGYTSARNTDGFSILSSGAAVISRAGEGSGTAGLLVYGAGNLNAKIQSDGSATFANTIEIQDFDTSDASTAGTRVQSGILKLQRPSSTPNTASTFEAWKGTTNVAKIQSDGSATFAGDVTVTKPSASGSLTVSSGSSSNFGQIKVQSAQQFMIGYGADHSVQPNELSLKNNIGDLTFYTNVTERFRITSTGTAQFAGDIETTTAATGVILKSSNGNRYRLTVLDNGTLSTTAV